MPKRALSYACAVSVSAALVAVPAVAQPSAPAPRLSWTREAVTTASGEALDAELAWLTVPERRSRPEGATIRLPVRRFKATTDRPGPPIIYLSGGPGVSGLEASTREIFPVIMALRARGDVVVFDQRGTGRAEPSLKASSRLDLPLDAPLGSVVARDALVAAATRVAAEIRARGIDLGAYNTVESADDVDAVRAALGVEQCILWGHSYGSHLALAVIRRHGAHVARAVLGGVNGPDQRWRQPKDLEDLIARVDARLDAWPRLRREVPSLPALVREVLERLEARPVTTTVAGRQVVVGRQEVEVVTALMAGDAEFVQSLPLFFGRLRDGDVSRVAQMIVTLVKARAPETAMRYAMHIASGVSAERAAVIDEQAGTALFRNAINFPFDDDAFRSAWGVADLGADYRSPIVSDVPTLFLSGDLDGRTSVADADAVRRGFSRGRAVLVSGAAHDFYHVDGGVVRVMLAFLDGQPFDDTVRVAPQFRGPSEVDLIATLRAIATREGAAAAVAALRRLHHDASGRHLSSYVAGTLAMGLWQTDKQPDAARAVFVAGVEMFPADPFLHERLADLASAQGDRATAAAHYARCVEINPLNRTAAAKRRQVD